MVNLCDVWYSVNCFDFVFFFPFVPVTFFDAKLIKK